VVAHFRQESPAIANKPARVTKKVFGREDLHDLRLSAITEQRTETEGNILDLLESRVAVRADVRKDRWTAVNAYKCNH